MDYVKFNRKGTPYVEYADLRDQPEVRDQLAAARRVLERVKRERAVKDAERGPGHVDEAA